MTQRKATFEAVLDACRKLLEQGKPTSAANILSIVGGSKQTVLEARRAALATLMEEGRGTDPSAAFQAAADPLLRKLWAMGRQQVELSHARQLKDAGAIREGLELDLAALQDALEDANGRAEAAEARLDEVLRSYDDLRAAFGVLADGLRADPEKGARAPRPSAREIGGVLAALGRLGAPATHEALYAEMAKDGWDAEAAHKARYRVMSARYAEHLVLPSDKGRDWVRSEGRDAG